jgi:hypothetical protein
MMKVSKRFIITTKSGDVDKNAHRPVATGPKQFVPMCDCTSEPWEECEHTEALANQSLKDTYGIHLDFF